MPTESTLTPESVDPLVSQFINWEQSSRDTIDFKKAYVDMADDLVAGLVLSQIVYWHLPGRDGVTRLRISRDGELWIAKRREDWWEEIRITVKQLDRALKILEKKNLVVTALYHFNDKPTKHVRLNWSIFVQTFSLSILPKGQNGQASILPKGQIAIYPKGKILYTETTPETTEENTILPISANASSAGDKISELDDPIEVKSYNGLKPALSIVEKAKNMQPSEPSKEESDPSPKVALKGSSSTIPAALRQMPVTNKVKLYKRVGDNIYQGPYAPSGNVVKAGGTFIQGEIIPQDATILPPEAKPKQDNPVYNAIAQLFVRVNPEDAQEDKDLDGLIQALYGKVVRKEKKHRKTEAPLTPFWADMAEDMVNLAWWYDMKFPDMARPKAKDKFASLLIAWYDAGKPKRPSGIIVAGQMVKRTRWTKDPTCTKCDEYGMRTIRQENGQLETGKCDCGSMKEINQ